MPWKVGSTALVPGSNFTIGGVAYPYRFLDNSTESERTALGISWQAPPASWDQRFYWGFDGSNNLIEKDIADLKKEWKEVQSSACNSILSGTDWMATRASEGGAAIPSNWKNWRAGIRTTCNNRQTQIQNVANVSALKSLLDTASTSWNGSAFVPNATGTFLEVWADDPDGNSVG